MCLVATTQFTANVERFSGLNFCGFNPMKFSQENFCGGLYFNIIIQSLYIYKLIFTENLCGILENFESIAQQIFPPFVSRKITLSHESTYVAT